MQNSRDSSVWRTLAIAFGDGLAFGVGVTLTRGAAQLAANRAAVTPEPPAQKAWNHEIEQRAPAAAAPPAQALLPAAIALPSIDRRFYETSQRIDRRLAALESKLQREFDSLDAQDHELAEGVEVRIDSIRREIAEAVGAQRQSIDTDMRALRAQMTTVHREFAETLSRLLEEQIGKSVATRVQTLEAELRDTVRENVDAQNVEARIDALRLEIGEAEAALRQSIDADMRALRAEITATHAEFRETLPRLVEQQTGETVAARMQSLEAAVRDSIRADVDARIEAVRREIGKAEAARAHSIDADMRALRAEITATHTEFAETLPRLVEQQTGKTVAARMQSLEADVRDSIRADVDARIEAVRREIGKAEAARAQNIDADMHGLRAEMTTLRKELAETLPHVVEEETAKTVAARMQSLQADVRDRVREDVDARIETVRRDIGEAEAARAQSIEGEMRALHAEITTVHTAIAETLPHLVEKQIGAQLPDTVDTRIEAVRREIGEAEAAQRQSIDAEMRTLRSQMTTVQKEFAETLARLVEQQISRGVATRVQTLEADLRNSVHEEARAAATQFDRGPEVAELRELLATQERMVRNLMTTLGQSCLQAVETIPPEPAKPDASAHSPSAPEHPVEAVADADLPAFAQTRPRKPLWRVPIVPSFFMATGSLLLLHYL